MFQSCKELLQPNTNKTESKLTFHYFPIAGRGELSKLLAIIGDVNMSIVDYPLELSNPKAEYKVKAEELGFKGYGLPLLEDGGFVLNQSGAIQDYIIRKSKTYPRLNPQQEAIDNMFSNSLEDAISGAAKVVFKSQSPDTLEPFLNKILGLLNLWVPERGFIHGLKRPTKADLCLFIMLEANMPFRVAQTMAKEYDPYEKYPKIAKLVERVKDYPPIKEYLISLNCSLRKVP